MDRLACVDLPALPLQLLLGRRREWADCPAAVVEHDKPQGLILWVNERARRLGVLPGQRYAAALALSGELRAAEVPAAEIATALDQVTERLRRFSPAVEPCNDEAGVFWLDADGLQRLYPSLETWATAIRADLAAAGLHAAVAVGFTRFGSYAVAKARPRRGVMVFSTARDEAAAMRRVPLGRIGLPPAARDALDRLAVRTVGAFLALPAAGVLRRFGREAHRLHRLGSGELWAPLSPRAMVEPVARTRELDDAESDVERLTFVIKSELDALLARLLARHQALAELRLVLTLDLRGERGAAQRAATAGREGAIAGVLDEVIRPAEPTLDGVQLLGLVRLRLETLRLAAGVTRVVTHARGVPVTAEQLQLLARKPRRDLAAAARALARVRAALGDQAVVRARLRDGHLPEARYLWEPIDHVVVAAPREVTPRPLVRRLTARPQPLPPRPAREPDGWLLAGIEHGPVERRHGPQRVAGGWWQQQVERDYYFAEMRSGALYWVFFDKRRQRWFLQGEIE